MVGGLQRDAGGSTGSSTTPVATTSRPRTWEVLVVIAARTLVDPQAPDDLAAVAEVQDRLALEAASDRAFVMPDYDTESLVRLYRPRPEILSRAWTFPSLSG